MMACMIVMMAAMKIRLSVTTAPAQALPCAEMAASVFKQSGLVTVVLLPVLTDLINLIFIPIAYFAQKRALCPAQVFQGIVQRYVTAGPRAQTIGMSFFPLVHLLLHNLARPMILSVVRRPASIRARTDPCAFIAVWFAILTRVVEMGAIRTLWLARTSVSNMP